MAEAPKLEVRKAREWRSHDGYGFEAEVWMDGKPLGTAVDEGNGGGCYLMGPCDRDAEQRLMNYIRTLPPEESRYGPLTVTLDYFLGRLVSRYLDDRRFKRLAKTQVLVDLGDDRVVGIRGAGRAAAVEAARKKYPGKAILNERLGVWPPEQVKRRGT